MNYIYNFKDLYFFFKKIFFLFKIKISIILKNIILENINNALFNYYDVIEILYFCVFIDSTYIKQKTFLFLIENKT